eukprot:CAMPEP_0194147090 /NCGR_PEP_ID=MMETSP0152-20130528/22514_1 /TAXON_ID=1049557 /ORGANISM="Thalassiothrix antarctica, Strain L6-D1" /LENGTH=479 /DNA_ID=CAMNT_0038847779 /DNA_START=70 /DNA_END=1509 /DNA_ORIENTATION=-
MKEIKCRKNDGKVQLALRLWILCVFFMAPTKDGLAPFFSTYLVASVGMDAGTAGLVWFIKEMAKLASQIPLGNLVDKTKHKRAILLLSISLLTFVPMTVIFTQNLTFIIFKSIIEGVATSGLEASRGPFTLGLSGGDENFDTIAKYAEAADHTGSLVAAILAGIVAYVMYPRVEFLFLVIGVMGCFAFFTIVFMPVHTNSNDRKSEIFNHDIARNSVSTKGKQDIETRNSELQEKGSIDEDKDNSSEENVDILPAISLRVLLSDRNLLYFTLAIFFYHFGNGAVMPLLGQILALGGGRAGIPYTSANIAIAQIVSVFSAYGMDYLVKKKGCRINIPILIGFGSIIPRVGSIIVLLLVWPNRYALIATQLFDGLGAGVNGLAIIQVTQLLTEGTGRYGFAVSVMRSAHFFGSSLSNLLSGYLITLIGFYEAGFGMLGVAAIISVMFVQKMKIPSRTSQIEQAEKTDTNALELTTGTKCGE